MAAGRLEDPDADVQWLLERTPGEWQWLLDALKIQTSRPFSNTSTAWAWRWLLDALKIQTRPVTTAP